VGGLWLGCCCLWLFVCVCFFGDGDLFWFCLWVSCFFCGWFCGVLWFGGLCFGGWGGGGGGGGGGGRVFSPVYEPVSASRKSNPGHDEARAFFFFVVHGHVQGHEFVP